MALRNKWEQLASLAPDVAVIQECEKKEKWPAQGYSGAEWFGSNIHKGLAVVTFGPWQVEACEQLDPSIQFILPTRITGPKTFNLLAVWTKQAQTKERSYIGQLHRAAQIYSSWLAAADSIVIGDWNSNAQWDHERRANHSATVALLADCGLISTYHQHYGCKHGSEQHPTWYNHKRADRGFHLDYCFVPRAWSTSLGSVQVGTFDEWRAYSDHCPLIVDLAERTTRGRVSVGSHIGVTFTSVSLGDRGLPGSMLFNLPLSIIHLKSLHQFQPDQHSLPVANPISPQRITSDYYENAPEMWLKRAYFMC